MIKWHATSSPIYSQHNKFLIFEINKHARCIFPAVNGSDSREKYVTLIRMFIESDSSICYSVSQIVFHANFTACTAIYALQSPRVSICFHLDCKHLWRSSEKFNTFQGINVKHTSTWMHENLHCASLVQAHKSLFSISIEYACFVWKITDTFIILQIIWSWRGLLNVFYFRFVSFCFVQHFNRPRPILFISLWTCAQRNNQ